MEKQKNDLSYFVQSTEIFQNIMGHQSRKLEKGSLGFEKSQKHNI